MTKHELARRFAIIFIAGISSFILILVVLALGTGYFLYTQAQVFSQNAELSLSEIRQIAETSWQKEASWNHTSTNILILGVDALENRGNAPPLTDTMMLASVNSNTGMINTLSLPRDLWSEEYQTKVNALYYYGQERYSDEPERFTEETLENLLGTEIDHTVVLSMNSLSDLIDVLGGIDVNVPIGFTDEEFPRNDVDVTTERDPEKLYKTVTFEVGTQTMDGQRTLEYIRSRHSDDDEGTDIARSKRQQLVINSLMSKIMRAETLTNPALMGRLLRYYLDNYDQYLPITDAGAIAISLTPHKDSVSINPHTLSVYPESEQGVIWHPPIWQYQNQWVYAIRDGEGLKKEVMEKLGYDR